MARPWQYTRGRFILMQAVMWLILAATVGLAALVVRKRSHPVELTQPVTLGRISLLLPKGWRVSTPGASNTPSNTPDSLKSPQTQPRDEARTQPAGEPGESDRPDKSNESSGRRDSQPSRRKMVTAREPPREGEPLGVSRRVTAVEESGVTAETADEYFLAGQSNLSHADFQWVMVGDRKWFWVGAHLMMIDPNAEDPIGQMQRRYVVFLCSLPRPGLAVTLRLEGVGTYSDEEQNLLKQIAGTVRVNGQ